MAIANRIGRFKATVLEVGAGESGPNNLTCVTFRFSLAMEYANGEWQDVRTENMEITAWCYVEKRDGALNTMQVHFLKQAFGWPGDDVFWFEEHAKELPACQVVLVWDSYQGQDKIKVNYINPENAEPGIAASDDATRKRVRARLGSKLRAISGGGRPMAKKPPPSVAPDAPIPPATKPMSVDAAWEEFSKNHEPAGLTEKELEAAWFNAITTVTGISEPTESNLANLTPEQWGAVASNIPF